MNSAASNFAGLLFVASILFAVMFFVRPAFKSAQRNGWIQSSASWAERSASFVQVGCAVLLLVSLGAAATSMLL